MLNKNTIIEQDLNYILKENIPWINLKNKSIAITGGNGFIATYMIKTLLKADKNFNLNLKIISIIRKESSSKITDKKLKIIKIDLFKKIPKNLPKIDIIIHAASKASPKLFKNHSIDIIKTNSLATMHLLDYATKFSEKFLYISSGEVYGKFHNSDVSIKEDTYGSINHLNDRSVYAESKKMGEAICQAYSQKSNCKVLIARPFHTYGPGINLDDGRVFSDFVNSVINKKDIILNTNGENYRPFCYISDATVAFLKILLEGKNANAYNVANPKCEIKIKDLANELAMLRKGNFIKVRILKKQSLSNPLKRQKVSIEKIKSLDWLPKIGIREGFNKTISYHIKEN